DLSGAQLIHGAPEVVTSSRRHEEVDDRAFIALDENVVDRRSIVPVEASPGAIQLLHPPLELTWIDPGLGALNAAAYELIGDPLLQTTEPVRLVVGDAPVAGVQRLHRPHQLRCTPRREVFDEQRRAESVVLERLPRSTGGPAPRRSRPHERLCRAVALPPVE